MLFSWKRRRTDPERTSEQINPLPQSILDWSAFEDSRGWTSIKIWLESDLVEHLDLLATYRHQSRSEVMRDLLFIALYGHFVYAQLVSERRGLLKEPGQLHSGERVFFDIPSNGDDGIEEPPKPGKKIENIRLFLPQPMKTLLEELSKKHNQTLSETSRFLIVRAMFGVAEFAST